MLGVQLVQAIQASIRHRSAPVTKPQKDDLEALRAILDALDGFDAADQERIIRWTREKLGIQGAPSTSATPPGGGGSSVATSPTAPAGVVGSATDIKSFVQSKSPTSDNQYVAVVAYFYRFQASPEARKESITGEDVLQACRLTGWNRPKRISQTMINAHAQGLLDRGERGSYTINTVGENLVALTLPAGSGSSNAPSGPRRARSPNKAVKSSKKAAPKKSAKAVKKVAKPSKRAR
jgi:hypothetical protein